MPQAYGYIRVSSDRQAESGLGLAAQRARIEEYCARVLSTVPLIDILADEGVSASQTPFLRRSNGSRLDHTVVRGDHIVIAKLDRAFRSLRDCATMMDHWTARGVIVHVLDISVATDSPLGQLIVGIMAAVAQWESRRIGERIREAMAVKRAQGRSPNGRPMLGYRLGPEQQLIADDEMRRVVARVVRWRDRHRLSFRRIAALLNAADSRTVMGRSWSLQTLRHAYRVGRPTTWHELLDEHDPATPAPARAPCGRISSDQRDRARQARRAQIAAVGPTLFLASVRRTLQQLSRPT